MRRIFAFYREHPEITGADNVVEGMGKDLQWRAVQRRDREDAQADPKGIPHYVRLTLKHRPFFHHWLNTGFYEARDPDNGKLLSDYLQKYLPYQVEWSRRFLQKEDGAIRPRTVAACMGRVEVDFHLRHMEFRVNGKPAYRPCISWEQAVVECTEWFLYILPITVAPLGLYEEVISYDQLLLPPLRFPIHPLRPSGGGRGKNLPDRPRRLRPELPPGHGSRRQMDVLRGRQPHPALRRPAGVALQSMRTSLKNVAVRKNIAGRYYQEGAVKAVCDSFDRKNRRRALLVMATGSGKTRTVIALCDVLLRHGWVKNILVLADRNSRVTQAKRSFVNLLPELSVTNLCEEKNNYTAHCVFSTYQTMMNCIDAVQDEAGKLFTCGHFDLVICDEAHRSIYNKYRDIFTYFDAPLVGLTATPKDEIDKNTYEVFELESGVPTYGYELAQAVTDGFLVNFLSVETKLKFLEQGIVYDELSDEDKAVYEDTFGRDGEAPDSISSSALNEWVFNEDTIRGVLHILMTNGLKIDYGTKLGKTIIFAKNHAHAEKILEVFGKSYPELPGYAKVIDNYTNYAQSAIDEFSEAKKLPQIAISVDMLDTGIDVPEVLNLVFFKKVMSKAKFWQMIGRGTRLCPGLIDGEDKEKFYIFDFCGNFEFFRMNKGKPAASQTTLQGALFKLKAQMAFQLQGLAYQTEELAAFRQELVSSMVCKAKELNRENFAVRQHLKYVERFSTPENYVTLSYEDTLNMETELIPLILPDEDDAKALRFDALMYGIELAVLAGKPYSRAKRDLLQKVSGIASVANIPEIKAQSELIEKILHTDYLESAGISDFEHIRECMRDLVKYIPRERATYNTNFDDEILSMDWRESELENDDLKNYKAKAEFYVR